MSIDRIQPKPPPPPPPPAKLKTAPTGATPKPAAYGTWSGVSTFEAAKPKTTMAVLRADLDPMGGAGGTFVDTRDYNARMGLLGQIAAAHPAAPGMPNPADGITIQTQWQLQSGRDQVDWWSRVNYSLSVVQFEALQQGGEFPGTVLSGQQPPPIQFSSAVHQSVRDYYALHDYVAQNWSSFTPTQRVQYSEQLQAKMWEFHHLALHDALNDPTTKQMMANLYQTNPEEAQFSDAWGNHMVGLLTSVNMPLDQTPIGLLNGAALPQHVLKPGDLDPATTTLTPLQLATATAGIAYMNLEKNPPWPFPQNLISRTVAALAPLGGEVLGRLRSMISEAFAAGSQGISNLWSQIKGLVGKLRFEAPEAVPPDLTAQWLDNDPPVINA